MSGKKGNTLGKVVGETPSASVPATGANPPAKAETPQENLGIQILDALQLGLDVAGLIPAAGETADLINAGISAARGDWIGAGLSLAAAVPLAGWGATAGKAARRGADLAAPGGRQVDELPAGGGAGGRGRDGAKIKPRRQPRCFKPQKLSKGQFKELDRQLQEQQEAINRMTAEEFLKARAMYREMGRNPAARIANQNMREDFGRNMQRRLTDELQRQGLLPDAARSLAASQTAATMRELHALHIPDMIAGGYFHPEPQRMGDAAVNRTIGRQWRTEGRIQALDEAAAESLQSGQSQRKMDVKLERCKP